MPAVSRTGVYWPSFSSMFGLSLASSIALPSASPPPHAPVLSASTAAQDRIRRLIRSAPTALERRSCQLDPPLDRDVGRKPFHFHVDPGLQDLAPGQLAGLQRRLHRLFHFALRGDTEVLEQLAEGEIEPFLVHGILVPWCHILHGRRPVLNPSAPLQLALARRVPLGSAFARVGLGLVVALALEPDEGDEPLVLLLRQRVGDAGDEALHQRDALLQ